MFSVGHESGGSRLFRALALGFGFTVGLQAPVQLVLYAIVDVTVRVPVLGPIRRFTVALWVAALVGFPAGVVATSINLRRATVGLFTAACLLAPWPLAALLGLASPPLGTDALLVATGVLTALLAFALAFVVGLDGLATWRDRVARRLGRAVERVPSRF
ncbi:hypothetical protein [Halospeciosus flavus]|uniref:Uncharacterized protein n=2 Tax=Halospeciosus flavus TaxID=3032283 RepID=A0ABD5Z8M5_9EURY|nr:hypothetical protein [Halospeciosus flavus]